MIEDYNDNQEDFKPWGMEENQFCMLMHLAQLAGWVIPMAGLVLPIVMWATNKEHSDLIDEHGKNILNWMISCIIYVVASIFLIFVFVGFITMFAVMICSLVFIIIGAVRANDGIIYKYPLAITFIK